MSIYFPTLTVANAVIRRGDEVVLVLQQGPNDPEPTWGLPGGVVEPGELIMDGVRREVREETGLEVVSLGRILWGMHILRPDLGTQLVGFAFQVDAWRGEPEPAPNDPDGLILEARFLPVNEAVECLSRVPWRTMREPAHAYLSGAAEPGAIWSYRRLPDGTHEPA